MPIPVVVHLLKDLLKLVVIRVRRASLFQNVHYQIEGLVLAENSVSVGVKLMPNHVHFMLKVVVILRKHGIRLHKVNEKLTELLHRDTAVFVFVKLSEKLRELVLVNQILIAQFNLDGA